MTTRVLRKNPVVVRSLLTVLAIAAAVLLPQLFHAVGALSGVGAAVGAAFLPMHLPVILAGFAAGPLVGIIAGMISPLVSFMLSGMPAVTLLPFMMLELAGYGLAAGLLAKTRMPAMLQVLLVQIAGRALRAAALLAAVYGLQVTAVPVASIWTTVTAGLFGILLQLVLIPLLMPYARAVLPHD